MTQGKATYLLPAMANPQVYTVTVQVTDRSGRVVAEGSAPVLADRMTMGEVLSFRPVADSWVDETRPDLNLGGGDALRMKGAAAEIPYLRFEVGGLTGPVQSAWLELEATRASSDGGTIHAVPDNGWDEFTITYNNRPAVDGPALDTVGAVDVGDVVVLDVTPAISRDGLYTFAIASSGSEGWAVRSREGSMDTPMLFIVLEPTP
jgi:hypothetical protein